MRQIFLLPIILTFSFILCPAQTNKYDGQKIKKAKLVNTVSATAAPDYTEWVSGSLTKIEKIKVGMRRADLLKIFTTEGGLFTDSERTYVYKECPLIKVDVEFKVIRRAVKDRNGQMMINIENDGDIITKISKPYLARTVLD